MDNVFYNSRKYDDIIDLPHHVSSSRPRMAGSDRAAQFAPFSALSGFGAAIKETGRQTDARIELSEDARDILDVKLQMIQGNMADHPNVAVTYFQPDGRKSGGSYITTVGCVKKIDVCERIMVMEDGAKIPLEEIIGIEGRGCLNTF